MGYKSQVVINVDLPDSHPLEKVFGDVGTWDVLPSLLAPRNHLQQLQLLAGAKYKGLLAAFAMARFKGCDSFMDECQDLVCEIMENDLFLDLPLSATGVGFLPGNLYPTPLHAFLAHSPLTGRMRDQIIKSARGIFEGAKRGVLVLPDGTKKVFDLVNSPIAEDRSNEAAKMRMGECYGGRKVNMDPQCTGTIFQDAVTRDSSDFSRPSAAWMGGLGNTPNHQDIWSKFLDGKRMPYQIEFVAGCDIGDEEALLLLTLALVGETWENMGEWATLGFHQFVMSCLSLFVDILTKTNDQRCMAANESIGYFLNVSDEFYTAKCEGLTFADFFDQRSEGFTELNQLE
ncbi:hypothetical protein BGZ99_002416, partial [Dissophora globulifera]